MPEGTQPTLHRAAKFWLGAVAVDQAVASTRDLVGGNAVACRIYLGSCTEQPKGWTHLRTVLRVETETFDRNGNPMAHGNRHFISSLVPDRLQPNQWMLAIRSHWGAKRLIRSSTSHSSKTGIPGSNRRPAWRSSALSR